MSLPAVIIIGTGALARALVEALSLQPHQGLSVHIFSRSHADSTWLATIGNVRAATMTHHQEFIPHEVEWDSYYQLTAVMHAIKPAIVLNTASLQSMESLQRANQWSALVRRNGYGITLPLQCCIALKVAAAIAAMPEPPIYVNCSYPDAVNRIIKERGFNVFSGIGNIGIIDQMLNIVRLSSSGHRQHYMLAGHYHVQELTKQPQERRSLPRIWIDQEEMTNTAVIFDQVIVRNHASLNAITALSGTALISAILYNQDVLLHLPAPEGRIGGYPVAIREGKIQSIGTGLIHPDEEQHWNQQILEQEGIVIQDSRWGFSREVFDSIAPYSKEIAGGCTYQDIDAYTEEFIRLRSMLETRGA